MPLPARANVRSIASNPVVRIHDKSTITASSISITLFPIPNHRFPSLLYINNLCNILCIYNTLHIIHRLFYITIYNNVLLFSLNNDFARDEYTLYRTRYIALNTFLILYVITNFFLAFLSTRDTLIRTKEIKFEGGEGEGGGRCGFGSRKNSIRLKGIDTVEAKHSGHFGRRKETIISLSLKRSVDGSVLKRKLDRIADLERHRANPAQARNVIVQSSSIGQYRLRQKESWG